MGAGSRRRVRVRFSNRFKCLLCYVACFALPLLYQAAGLWLVYPYRLASTAPSLARTLLDALPMLEGALGEVARRSELAGTLGPQALLQTLAYRDLVWRVALGGWFALAWLTTLLWQLGWRAAHAKPVMAARATQRAVASYRVNLLLILALNAGFAAVVWLVGVQFIQGRTAWDYLTYFVAYALNVLAALCCFRLAAPPVLSGRRAFFKRL